MPAVAWHKGDSDRIRAWLSRLVRVPPAQSVEEPFAPAAGRSETGARSCRAARPLRRDTHRPTDAATKDHHRVFMIVRQATYVAEQSCLSDRTVMAA